MASHDKSGEVADHSEQPAPDHDVDVAEAAAIADSALHVKPSLWTLSMLRLYGCLLVGYLCATTNGFDGAVMGFVLTVPPCAQKKPTSDVYAGE